MVGAAVGRENTTCSVPGDASVKTVDESDRSSTIFRSASLEALSSGVLLAPTAPTTFPPPPALV